MIEINLLPDELRKKQTHLQKLDLKSLNLEGLPVVQYAAAVFGVVIAIQIVLLLIAMYSKNSFAQLDRKYKTILPEKKQVAALNSRLNTLQTKTGAINELMLKRFNWTKKLNDLSDSMTPGIWLTELSYEEKVVEKPVMLKAKTKNGPAQMTMERSVARYLILAGYASSRGEEATAAVGKFIKSLKDNRNFFADFGEIELGSIQSDRIEEQDVMNFRITCLFK